MSKTAKVLEPCAPGATIVSGEVLNSANASKLEQFVAKFA